MDRHVLDRDGVHRGHRPDHHVGADLVHVGVHGRIRLVDRLRQLDHVLVALDVAEVLDDVAAEGLGTVSLPKLPSSVSSPVPPRIVSLPRPPASPFDL
jgi:hypothetical protein